MAIAWQQRSDPNPARALPSAECAPGYGSATGAPEHCHPGWTWVRQPSRAEKQPQSVDAAGDVRTGGGPGGSGGGAEEGGRGAQPWWNGREPPSPAASPAGFCSRQHQPCVGAPDSGLPPQASAAGAPTAGAPPPPSPPAATAATEAARATGSEPVSENKGPTEDLPPVLQQQEQPQTQQQPQGLQPLSPGHCHGPATSTAPATATS
ncbi:hypothetical protein PLESTB_001619500 [Pleodorina starrii]|uniref:Uncharacterized protein n=1 Tax=Pleodorina starrii TaxID=330485 RepID=A0A9W6BYA5_9CHLO|nr:hypothetical protein PLESTM_001891600 [Pleodorina starrii]GLC60489.1 hypothetical protein PLESTB_001619500 [Pleodorina starrii]